MYRLKSYLHYRVNNNQIEIYSLKKKYKFNLKYKSFFEKIKNGILTSLEMEIYKKLIDFLNSENLLVLNQEYPNNSYKNNFYYYEAYTQNPLEIHKKFKNYSIGIIGCGGIGSMLVDQLIGINIKNIVLVDFDIIDISNLNRQFCFNPDDVGKLKTNILEKYCHSKKKDLNISTIKRKILSSKDLDDLKSMDLIINAADSPHNLGDIIINFCSAHKIDYISCGVGLYSGYIGPFLDFSTKKYKKITFEKSRLNNKFIKELNPVKGSLGITNSLVSNILANEIFNYNINGRSNCLKKIIKINFKNYDIELINLEGEICK